MIGRRRIAELERVLGSEPGELITGLLRSLTRSIEQIDAAATAGELDAVARAAHSARNDALILEADPLLAALDELEQAARYAESERVQRATGEVQRSWRAAQDELIRLSQQ